MIRSGSTLQYNIVKDLLINSSKKYKLLGFFDKEKINIKFIELKKKALDTNIIYLIKTHDFTRLNELNNVQVIYSYRNLMDVAASVKRKFGKTGDELLFGIEKSINDYYGIINSKDLLIQRYEKLLKSLEDCVKEISVFINVDISQEDIEEITFNNSTINIIKIQNKNRGLKLFKLFLLDTLLSTNKEIKRFFIYIFGREFINKLKYKLVSHDKSTLLHLDHISKNFGKNGNWEETLEEEEIIKIKAKFKKWLDMDINS